MLKIGIVGPESSGKSELSKRLAQELNCPWIPEYAREYLENLNRNYDFDDLETIARKEFDLINSVAAFGCENCDNTAAFCFIDTELIVMKVWSEFKYQKCSNFILENILKQNIDFYFLCYPDIPWEDDPLRENPNDRIELFEIYENELKKYKFPYFIVKGEHLQNRVQTCLEALRKI